MTNVRLLIISGVLIGLAACSQQITYREGATTAEVQRAEDSCKLAALEQAPVRKRTRIIPGEIIPARKVCDADGACVVYPAYREAPEIETYDENEEKRRLLVRSCLASRGFDRVRLPYCDAEARTGVTPGVTRTLPRLTEQSCIIPRGSGAYQIVAR